jgi:hypothetical protein
MSAKSVETVENGTEIFIPLNKPKKSPKNARKTPHSEAAIEAYAASIAAKGILQNLVVEPEFDAEGAATGCYFVTIGEGRRLAQLLRAKRKEIKKTEPIRCIVDTANDPHEISLDENVTRENMHPADQFEAFKKLAQERGLGAEEIAARLARSRPFRGAIKNFGRAPEGARRLHDSTLSTAGIFNKEWNGPQLRQLQKSRIVTSANSGPLAKEASILSDQVGPTEGPDQPEPVAAAFACHQRVDRRGRGVIPDTEAGPMLPRGLLAPPHQARRDP